jgi:hypothetical protein
LKRSLFVVALAGIALVSLPFDASAQAKNAVQVGVAGGLAIPVSDLGDATDMGFNVTGMVGFHPQMIPLGIRVDVAYNRFDVKDNNAGIEGNFNFTSVTGNLIYSIPSPSVAPYLIGGAGWYHAKADIPAIVSGSGDKFGWNIGGGIKLPLSGFDTFLEARYNQIQGDGGSIKFVPITFGIMF